jgi:hypothetical protein
VQSYKNIVIKDDPYIKSKVYYFVNYQEQRYCNFDLCLGNASKFFDASSLISNETQIAVIMFNCTKCLDKAVHELKKENN